MEVRNSLKGHLIKAGPNSSADIKFSLGKNSHSFCT